uniref:Cytochrome c oxidase polypeptide VIa n=1 Tax=Glossina austeni TaxID=7395 RepID=A0A1A9VT02_GLOAU
MLKRLYLFEEESLIRGISTYSIETRRQIFLGAPRLLKTNANAKEQSGGHKMWKRLSIVLAIPIIGLSIVNAYLALQKKEPRPSFVKYDHLGRHEKRFPWGDGMKSLFHNPHTNALPKGYEN